MAVGVCAVAGAGCRGTCCDGGQGRQQGPWPTTGSRAAVESWLSVCFPVAAVSWRCGEAASGTDGVPSPERVRGDGAQLQGSGLVSCTHGDTEAWEMRIPGSSGVAGLGASANTNTCGAKADEVCRGSVLAVLAVSLFIDEICWVCLQVAENHSHSSSGTALGSPHFSSVFLAISVPFGVAHLGGVKLKQDLCACPRGWGI